MIVLWGPQKSILNQIQEQQRYISAEIKFWEVLLKILVIFFWTLSFKFKATMLAIFILSPWHGKKWNLGTNKTNSCEILSLTKQTAMKSWHQQNKQQWNLGYNKTNNQWNLGTNKTTWNLGYNKASSNEIQKTFACISLVNCPTRWNIAPK